MCGKVLTDITVLLASCVELCLKGRDGSYLCCSQFLSELLDLLLLLDQELLNRGQRLLQLAHCGKTRRKQTQFSGIKAEEEKKKRKV